MGSTAQLTICQGNEELLVDIGNTNAEPVLTYSAHSAGPDQLKAVPCPAGTCPAGNYPADTRQLASTLLCHAALYS